MKKYQAFVKTVEFGSFTKAAESMNYSQSGISKMVAELEKEWGLTLLERDRGGIRLTAAAACQKSPRRIQPSTDHRRRAERT